MLTEYSNNQIIDAVRECMVEGSCKRCPLYYERSCYKELLNELKCLIIAYRVDGDRLEKLRRVLENEK